MNLRHADDATYDILATQLATKRQHATKIGFIAEAVVGNQDLELAE
jgi:hypothetical protein